MSHASDFLKLRSSALSQMGITNMVRVSYELLDINKYCKIFVRAIVAVQTIHLRVD